MLLQRFMAASSAHVDAGLPVLAFSCASLSVQDMPVLARGLEGLLQLRCSRGAALRGL